MEIGEGKLGFEIWKKGLFVIQNYKLAKKKKKKSSFICM